jgi:hypothetical protein
MVAMDDLELSALIVGSFQKLADLVGCSRQNMLQHRGKAAPAELAGKIELAVRRAVAEDPEAAKRANQLGRLPLAENLSGREYHRDADGGLHLTIGRSSHPSIRRRASKVPRRALQHGRTPAPLARGR